MRFLLLFTFILAVSFSGAAARAEDAIQIQPRAVQLSSIEARQRLIVMFESSGKLRGEAREGIDLTSSNPAVARIEGTTVVPVANGKAEITAKRGAATDKVTVTVSGQDLPFTWSFRNHVVSVFSKQGCNGGACHGALKGKNGFRLRLFGYDPEADFQAITREDRGRRVVLTDPGRSLLLSKPSGLVPHKGGIRLEADSREYRVVAEWIAAGTPPPKADDAKLTRLEVLPEFSVQPLAAQQQIVVLAHFSDGHVEDVTTWAKYRSTDEAVASIDGQGLAKITGPGEVAFHVWYQNHNALAFASVPYKNALRGSEFASLQPKNFIDELVLEKLKDLRLPPSPQCDDATYLRRAMLATLGVLPTADEVRRFLADTDPLKRDKLVEELLARPEFVDYWTYRWSDLLLVSGERLRPDAVKAYSGWIRARVKENTPWDEMVRQIVVSRGSTLDNGAANFYALHQDPTDMAETVSQAFLGMSIQCAKCHNHPLEKWTNDQYYGFANLFARVKAKGWGGDFRSGDGNRIIYTDDEGELLQPSRGYAQPPTPLDGPSLAFNAPGDRRAALADWLTSPKNPYFTRAIVNRVWADFLGEGLIEKVDDIRLTNPPSNEKLMAALEKFLVAEKYDLKKLMAVILRSSTYQRSSEPLPGNQADTRFYSHYYPRRLSAEVLLDAVSQSTGVPTKFKQATMKGDETIEAPAGTRALQLPDANVASYFLSTFGRPSRLITCECERSDEPSMVQVLHLVNGDTVNLKLQSPESRIAKQLAAKQSPEEIIEELYLLTLSRQPTAQEKSKLAAEITAAPEAERRAVVEDLYWSVMSSKEFLFQH